MTGIFVGRTRELTALRKRLDQVTATGQGTALTLRGRRQIGKSRLVQEFCERAGTPHLFFAATKGLSPIDTVSRFLAELIESTLPAEPDSIPIPAAATWPDALRILAGALPAAPSIVILDEAPWLAEQDPTFDGALQTAWDRLLSPKPVLLLLLGSDLHMMERLTAYDHPFFGRADNLVLDPLNPAEIGSALGLGGADALDAHLVCGGLPGILRTWPAGMPALEFLRQECDDPAAAVFSVPESTLVAEFPVPDQTRRVLESIGNGERTQSTIAAAAGGHQGAIPTGSLSPLLRRLSTEKHILCVDEPLATKSGKPALYRIADSNLRLYLAMLRSAQDHSRRGRPDAAFRVITRRWQSWRGKAVEPLVRDALSLVLDSDDFPWPGTETIGAWWNRQFNPEIDLVGADRSPAAKTITFAGSIKWLGTPFDRHDLAALHAGAAQIPGFTPGSTGLAVVSLSGIEKSSYFNTVGLIWSANDIVTSWTT